MRQSFKTKLLAGLFVPALSLAAGATYATGTAKMNADPSAGNTATTSPAATANGMNNSTRSGTASADATFDRLDANHDGKLSSSEAATDTKVHGMWKKLDANHDGSVSKSEFEAQASNLQ